MYSADPYPGLPDPDLNAGFYDGVPAKRAIAWVVDTVLIVLVTALIVPFTAFTALFFLPLLFLTVGFLYRWVTLTTRSATWGMRLVAIEFRRFDGSRFDGATAFLHTLGFTVSVSMVLPQLVSIALMLTTARGQGLSDIVLGTAAINRPAAM
ncbi:RDD family protein [Acidimangrovimonas pyrenivorans]|uniref:RDD family protein n=1 Tax=Acidimangrovimonas pyrenivorans TaxID=2030798 RepID=A0ABV7AFV9_9RHOB